MADIDNSDLKKWGKALERLNRITKDFVRFRRREKSIVGDEVEVLLRGSRATLMPSREAASPPTPFVRPLRTQGRSDLLGAKIYMLLRDSLKCVANVEGGKQLTNPGRIECRPLRTNLTDLGPIRERRKMGA